MAYVCLISEEPHPGEVSGPWTKIGYTKNPPEWRLDANLTRGNSRVLSVLTAFKYPTEADAQVAERLAHQQFAGAAVRKKWFRVDPPQVDQWFLSTRADRRTPDDIKADKAKYA